VKKLILSFIIGISLGGFLAYRLMPSKEVIRNNVVTVTETKKDGTTITKVIDNSIVSKPLTANIPPRNNLLQFNYSLDGYKTLTYGRQALIPNLYFTIGLTQQHTNVVPIFGVVYTF
jgi:hypothetical protein